LPLPVPPEIVIQGTLAVAVQLHALSVVRSSVPLPPPAPYESDIGETV
jgi:hypothetical protein